MKPEQLTAHADGKLLAGVVDRVGHVVINNPERHNAISLDMYRAGAAEVVRMANDPETRLLVIRGAGGKAFASGADISKFEKERSSAEDVEIYAQASKSFYDAVFNFPKPTVAVIQGFCIGGGMGLAVACDIRLCEDKSRFAVPAAKLAPHRAEDRASAHDHGVLALARRNEAALPVGPVGADHSRRRQVHV